MIKFKKAKSIVKQVLADDSKEANYFRKLFKDTPATPTGWKKFSQMRSTQAKGKELFLIINPETKDYVINVVDK